MSSVRMCDKCGLIFSENSEDWSTGTISVKTRNDKTGANEFKSVSQDQCGPCSTGEQAPAPRVAIETGPARYDAGYTANLERSAGIATAEVVG